MKKEDLAEGASGSKGKKGSRILGYGLKTAHQNYFAWQKKEKIEKKLSSKTEGRRQTATYIVIVLQKKETLEFRRTFE